MVDRQGYSRLRLTQFLIALTVAVLAVWLGNLSWPTKLGFLAVGLLLGYPLGRRRWLRARSRVDRRNVLILYFSESVFYLILIVLYAFKSFPLMAGWVAFKGSAYSDAFMSIIVLVASVWLGFDVAFLRGVRDHERDRGPIRLKFFHSRSVTGQQGMIGMVGRVTQPCSPEGKVEIRGEIWNAVSIDGSEIPAGGKAVVRDIEEMDLIVERVG